MSAHVRYLVPPGLGEKDLPPEVQAGLRLCVMLAARLVETQSAGQQGRPPGSKPGTEPGVQAGS